MFYSQYIFLSLYIYTYIYIYMYIYSSNKSPRRHNRQILHILHHINISQQNISSAYIYIYVYGSRLLRNIVFGAHHQSCECHNTFQHHIHDELFLVFFCWGARKRRWVVDEKDRMVALSKQVLDV